MKYYQILLRLIGTVINRGLSDCAMPSLNKSKFLQTNPMNRRGSVRRWSDAERVGEGDGRWGEVLGAGGGEIRNEGRAKIEGSWGKEEEHNLISYMPRASSKANMISLLNYGLNIYVCTSTSM